MRRILCFGDSNTFGTAPQEALKASPIHPKSVRWASVMASNLGTEWDTVVEGLPGRTTVFDDTVEGSFLNGRRSFEAILRSHQPIDLLMICLGTNDAKARFGLGPQDIALGVARLLLDAKAMEIVNETLVVCPPPVRERGDLAEMFAGGAARMAGLPAQMERFAVENGAHFLDAGKFIEVDPLDGVHWSAESHAILGQAMADKAREMFA